MFREMRRKKQALTEEEIIKILTDGTAGVLAVDGDGGYPYAVPLSYVYHDGKIFFHCAKSGHKLDAIRRNPKASFCVIGQDQVMPQEYTTYFRSVIAFGKVRILEDDAEKWDALRLLAKKYYPEAGAQAHDDAIRHDYAPVCIVELIVEYMTGKEAIELARNK
ncbi:MAG TPA: pyridoxamine 5'-phosphate oxidase family protein [Candidatus Onthovicinus excrementipullorum]|nr:pyridoxamine 5'-phosphate oxidase family protein [Candidatus Onthovicinus excrementipullorum]